MKRGKSSKTTSLETSICASIKRAVENPKEWEIQTPEPVWKGEPEIVQMCFAKDDQ